MDTRTQRHIDQWLEGDYDAETKAQVKRLVNEDPQGAINAFYTTLSFGTGGLRGIVGVGCNRMNKYTVGAATQGLANYIKKQGLQAPSVLIGYDSRHESPLFAHEAALVLAGNGITVHLFRQLRPTPLVSFGCRARRCSAAIMITASHNPPQYNGYKVYWSDGGQVLPPHDCGIIHEVQQVTELNQIRRSALDTPLIHWIDEELDDEYLKTCDECQLYAQDNQNQGKSLKVVYSSLHGAGITLVPKILRRWGFDNLVLVPQQSEPNGAFPTVKSANPEERAALALGIDALMACEGDLLLATDPDADRVGVAVRCGKEVQLLTGNQVGAICLEHICRALVAQKRVPERAAFVKTIVTTPLCAAIAKRYGVASFDTLPGFKYISGLIQEWATQGDSQRFVFGAEESYGYLLGTASRDKDGIISCALLCEVALQAKLAGKTLVDLLNELYATYGIYCEKLISLNFPETKEGREQMTQAMKKLRQSPPKRIGEADVASVDDYLTHAPSADILRFSLADGSWVVVRPSGTEPKVKVYGGVFAKANTTTPQLCEQRLEALLNALTRTVQ